MRKKVLFSILSAVCLLLCSCGEKEGDVSTTEKSSISGRVTDYATGEVIANANVSLLYAGTASPTGYESSLTGSDGEYSFLNVADGNYIITVSKAGYTDLVDDYVIKVTNGQQLRHDVQIKQLPAYIRITDVEGNDIHVLDFGDEVSAISRPFNIFNNGTSKNNCSLEYSCNWIRSVSPIPNPIAPGQTVTVIVEIDRSKLIAGVNTTNLYVISNNGNGSNVLEIRATTSEVVPQVLTLPVTNPDGTEGPFMNTFHANVVNVGNPAYTKRGFCWSSTNSTPTVYDNNVEVPGTGKGEYSYTWRDIPIPTTHVTYYIRAWVKYGSNNTIVYGNVQSYVFNNV